jgi:hypothetical protein
MVVLGWRQNHLLLADQQVLKGQLVRKVLWDLKVQRVHKGQLV